MIFFKKQNQNGNVLFLILIAVALFAALSYVISSSNRGTPGNTNREKTQLDAGDIIQYAGAIEQATERARVASSVPEWQLDYWIPFPGGGTGFANTSCTTDDCRIFAPKGGAVIRRPLPVDKTVASYTGGEYDSQTFYVAAIKNVGSDDPELLFFHGWVPAAVCQQINYNMGITTSPTAAIPADSIGAAPIFNGTFTSFPSSSKVFGDSTNPEFRGKRDFCYSHSYWGHAYVHVLIAR